MDTSKDLGMFKAINNPEIYQQNSEPKQVLALASRFICFI